RHELPETASRENVEQRPERQRSERSFDRHAKTRNAIGSRMPNVTIPTATYAICLPERNSNLLMGVERKFAIDPVSFSRTTAMLAMIAGIKTSIITTVLGIMAKTLLKAWL